jgi:hypothetical protein
MWHKQKKPHAGTMKRLRAAFCRHLRVMAKDYPFITHPSASLFSEY